jgi:hypothetical protein
MLLEQGREAVERRRGALYCAIDVLIEQRQHRFGKPGQVPLRDRRLATVGVSPAMVDGAEHGGGS